MDICTPKLDDNKDPQELTVPLKSPTTYKIDSPEAENVLPQYYKVMMKCLTLTTGHKIQVFKFNKEFYDWLTQAVLPHLKDDKCYPAFGGVLRIVETMRQKDFVPKNSTANFIFYRQRDLDKHIQETKKNQTDTGRIFRFPYFPLIVVTWVIFILILCIFLMWRSGRCFCRCCGCGKEYDSDSSSTEVFYYPIEETPSISLDLDGVSSNHTSLETEPSSKASGGDHPYRPGYETQVYTMTYEQQQMLTGVPLKRQCSSENSLCSSRELKSPGKRHKIWSGIYK
ncbi:uncharacterized protein LOC128995578 [Macrosteles quadrilineatus]|uniref:uncharacterized protein LOC128995578 n=1 Tax=Macrosteles quadrilineatus TaxID=74068 RepID=UPI0023E28FD1|nr:uncharacterized protein LOC128995578 [Macrosteles quadrilineatus]